MKNLLVLVFALFLLSCSNYGDKVVYDGTEIYYKDNVLQEKADQVGAYLEEIEFTDGTPKSVQITKDSVYNFRMVIQKGLENDESMEMSFKALGFLLSKEVFDGAPLNYQLCDNTFTTLKTIPIEGASEFEE